MRENIKYVNVAALQLAKKQEAEAQSLEAQIKQMDQVFLWLLGLAVVVSGLIIWGAA